LRNLEGQLEERVLSCRGHLPLEDQRLASGGQGERQQGEEQRAHPELLERTLPQPAGRPLQSPLPQGAPPMCNVKDPGGHPVAHPVITPHTSPTPPATHFAAQRTERTVIEAENPATSAPPYRRCGDRHRDALDGGPLRSRGASDDRRHSHSGPRLT